MDQARVSREAGTIIRYSLPPGTLTAVVALAPTSKVAAGQGATGDTQTILNTRPLSAGPGSVTLNMDLTLPDMPNPGFKSFGVRGTAITSVQVTWI
jgi:hypothetical protein